MAEKTTKGIHAALAAGDTFSSPGPCEAGGAPMAPQHVGERR